SSLIPAAPAGSVIASQVTTWRSPPSPQRRTKRVSGGGRCGPPRPRSPPTPPHGPGSVHREAEEAQQQGEHHKIGAPRPGTETDRAEPQCDDWRQTGQACQRRPNDPEREPAIPPHTTSYRASAANAPYSANPRGPQSSKRGRELTGRRGN